MNGSLGTLIQLGFYFFVSSHFISCAFCLIGSYEYANKTRFNKMTLFGNFSGNSAYIQEPIEELTPLGLYGQMWYFAADIIANVSYGDIVRGENNDADYVGAIVGFGDLYDID